MDTTHPLYDPAAEPPDVGEHDGFAIYPMPTWVSLETTQITATVELLGHGLGFDTIFEGPVVGGAPMLTHLRLGRYQDILITPPRGPVRAGTGLTPSFMCVDVDALADQMAVAGAAEAIIDGPTDQPWGARELTVALPDGHRLTFSQPPAAPPTRSLQDTMQAVSEAPRGA